MALTYPVDTSAKYFIMSISTETVVRKDLRWPRADGGQVVIKNSDWVPGLMIDDPIPAYNPQTHKLEFSEVLDPVEIELHKVATIVPLTQAELDSLAAEQDRLFKKQTLANSVATLRTWADEAGAITVTTANAVSVLQQTVDHLSVFFDRFADLIEVQRDQ